MPLMRPIDYARHREVTPAAVNVWMSSGKIDGAWQMDRMGKKLIDSEKADALLDENQHTTRAKSNNIDPKTRRKIIPTTDEDAAAAGFKTTSGPTYMQSRTVRETYQARIAKLNFEEMSGKLVDAEKVRMQAFETARKVRDAILSLPDRLSTQLAAETDAHKIHRTLTEELNLALQALADDFKRN